MYKVFYYLFNRFYSNLSEYGLETFVGCRFVFLNLNEVNGFDIQTLYKRAGVVGEVL